MHIPRVRRHNHRLMPWLILIMILSGCSGRSIVSSSEDHTPPPGPSPTSLKEGTNGVPQAEPELRIVEEPIASVPPAELSPPPFKPPAELADVYFDFDQHLIRRDARPTLNHIATLLKSEPNQELIIEGYCDERGTSAYNLVLGERRAQSVKRFLGKQGLNVSHIQAISYGKERPVCTEHSEACWQSNRRVHFRRP